MTDPVSAWAFGAIAGGAVGFWMGRWWPRFSRYSRRRPYSSAAIEDTTTNNPQFPLPRVIPGDTP